MVKTGSESGVAGNANSDYTPTNKRMIVPIMAQVVLTTDATVANRRVLMQILDTSSNVVVDVHAGAVVAASQSNQHHEFMQGVYRETSFVGSALQVPMPRNMVIPDGYTLRFKIENGQAGDSYNTNLVYEDLHHSERVAY